MRSGGRLTALPLLLLLLLLLPPPACAAGGDETSEHPGAGSRGHGHRHWSYADKAKWASDFSSCGGLMQSPINIETAGTRFSTQLKPLLLSGYNLPSGEKLLLQNNGHTIVLDLPGNMTLAGGGFPQPYKAAQLHLHWGSTSVGPGSEHTVDGLRYAGEVGSEENEPYQHILEHLDDVHEEGEEAFIPGFDVAKLLPENLERYFRYDGSLTTPPCHQTVTWTLFNQTIRLSHEQISVLEDSLYGDDDKPIQSNFRLPQRLNGRSVLASFPTLQAPRRTLPPGKGDSPRTPVPYGPTEGGSGLAPGEDAGKQLGSSLRTGDTLAILFGALFVVTAVAFLLYIQQHRSQNHRQDLQGAKPSVQYAAATTEENPV